MEMSASTPFSHAFDFASGAIAERFQNPLWRITECFFGGRFRKAVAEVKAFGSSVVATALDKRRNREQIDQTSRVDTRKLDQVPGSLINSFIDEIKDPEMVADAALNFLSAGRFMFLARSRPC